VDTIISQSQISQSQIRLFFQILARTTGVQTDACHANLDIPSLFQIQVMKSLKTGSTAGVFITNG
jgi:hypothetical protein